MKNQSELNALFEEKVRMIESQNNMDLFIYFMIQVGHRDAIYIINQMKAFFISGYTEARKDILGA